MVTMIIVTLKDGLNRRATTLINSLIASKSFINCQQKEQLDPVIMIFKVDKVSNPRIIYRFSQGKAPSIISFKQ